jgi:hypothetical protein
MFTGWRMLAPETRDDLSRMQAVLPGYQVTAARCGSSYRFEAVRRPDGPKSGPWCVISSDPADLWRELGPWTRRPQASRPAAARLPMP